MSKIEGALPKLAAVVLTALVCVGCNSEPEPEVEAAMPDEQELSEADADDNCTLDVPDAVVDVSQLDTSSGLLSEFGGLCNLSNIVLASAAQIHLPANVTSIPSDILHGAKLNIYSMGTAEFDNTHCPAVVWSLRDDEQGHKYNVTSLGNCADIRLPHSQLFNPELNPDAQLPGDYIRETLSYNGSLPSYYELKGTRYRFVSEEKLVETDDAQPSRMAADRSVLGGAANRYIYWSSGKNSIDNGYLTAAEALVLEYRAVDLENLQPPERALAALQRTYGAPSVEKVELSEEGMQPGLLATVVTTSGDRFVMIMESAHGLGVDEMSEWLLEANVELLVVQSEGVGANENLSLDGALFTDGDKTVFGLLEPCDCSTQGALSWLGQEQVVLVNDLAQSRQEFIDRARKTAKFQDWVYSSEFTPRAIGYATSRYDRVARNNDAAFVVHDGGLAHTLYVAIDLACKEESLVFDFSGKMFDMAASCEKLDSGAVLYTLLEESDEISQAMRNEIQMSIALLEPGASEAHEKFQFSLMGSSDVADAIAADEANFSISIVEHFSDDDLSTDAEQYLFAQLKDRPVFCRSGTNIPGCVYEQEEPVVAAAKPVIQTETPTVRVAKPVASAAKRAKIENESTDFTMGYAKVLAEQIGAGNEADCKVVVNQIMEVASSSGASDERALEIDMIVGRAPTICF